MGLIRLLLPSLLLAACATPEPALVEPASVPIKSQPLKYLVGRTFKPMPDKALEVRTRCSFRDVGGGRGTMDLLVTKAEVKRFAVDVSIPGRGTCHFEMKQFQQTARLPNVELTDNSSGCIVRMWEQGKGVTVALSGCPKECSGDAFSYLWPILVDTRNGRCS